LEGQYVIHGEALNRHGYDAEPVSRMEVQQIVNSLAKESPKPPLGGMFRVAQLASPTGFAEDAVAWVLSGAVNGSNLAIGLVDLSSGEFICPLDEDRLVGFSPLLAPKEWAARISAAVAAIVEILVTQKSLAFDNALSRLGEESCVIRAAFAELAGEQYTVDELADLGLVISRSDG
jgi:hypothetical protein